MYQFHVFVLVLQFYTLVIEMRKGKFCLPAGPVKRAFFTEIDKIISILLVYPFNGIISHQKYILCHVFVAG